MKGTKTMKEIQEMKETLVKTSKDIGGELKLVREARQMSRKDLGIKCGLSEASASTTIARYENGKSVIHPEMLNKIADALEIDVILTIRDRRNTEG